MVVTPVMAGSGTVVSTAALVMAATTDSTALDANDRRP
jgi:hypothetical protein